MQLESLRRIWPPSKRMQKDMRLLPLMLQLLMQL